MENKRTTFFASTIEHKRYFVQGCCGIADRDDKDLIQEIDDSNWQSSTNQ